jgi:hypothetical protein
VQALLKKLKKEEMELDSSKNQESSYEEEI